MRVRVLASGAVLMVATLAGPAATAEPAPAPPAAPVVTGPVVQGLLGVPWGVAFLPDGDALVTLRDSNQVIRVAPDGTVTPISYPAAEVKTFGIVLSPDFAQNKHVFIQVRTDTVASVVRLTLQGDRLVNRTKILGGIPVGRLHGAGRLIFGPDGYLYVPTGDTDDSTAQSWSSRAGKILRVTETGAPAPGNPRGTAVWSLGHRNIEGLAFDSAGRLWSSEFGEDAFDELNLIVKGGNYGWPIYEGQEQDPAYVNPKRTWTPDVASPAGIAIRNGFLYMAALRGQRLWRMPLNGVKVGAPRAFLVGAYGRLRTVVNEPSGQLWLTTSNRDNQGVPGRDDDQILHLTD